MTAFLVTLIAACSDGNGSAIFDPDRGKHPDNWYVEHRAAFLSQPETCQECHGADLMGGISKVSCFSASFKGLSCHANGPSGHPAGWSDPDSHGAEAKAAPGTGSGFASCQVCHGNDFAGGQVNQSCFPCHGVDAPHSPAPWRGGVRTHTNTNAGNAAVCSLCHASGQPGTPGCFNNTLCHGSDVAPHLLPFTDPADHGPPAKADLTVCQACHANPSDGGPGSNPAFNVPVGSLTNGCEDCHEQGTAHPVPWSSDNDPATSHQTAGNMAIACALCHGVNLNGGAGPACTTCHEQGSPLTALNCSSCHGKPPSEGAHQKHNALTNVTGICDSCHNGAGSGTPNHFYNGVVDVAFLQTYNAKSGTAVFNIGGGTCSSVSCHGAQTTPVWLGGTLNVDTQCTLCHRSRNASDQYNSYFSGEHDKHVSGENIACTVCHNIACTVCHNTVKLQDAHFTFLNTPAMEGPASATLNDALNYNGTSCNPEAGGLNGCHASHNW